jgi:phage FluMu gp28-like protein
MIILPKTGKKLKAEYLITELFEACFLFAKFFNVLGSEVAEQTYLVDSTPNSIKR